MKDSITKHIIERSVHIKKSNTKRYKQLLSKVGNTIFEYGLIEDGDRIMTAVSGGKDSLGLLHLLLEIKRKAPISFDVFAYTLDQAQPEYDGSDLEKHYQKLGIEYYLERKDTYSVVIEKTLPGKTYCSLCSRLRRGILYKKKTEYKATKLALGHHADDAMETLLMNLFYSGRMAAIAPKLFSDDKQHTVIRPLIEVDESEMKWLAQTMKFPVIPCNLCNNQKNLQRQRMKRWIHNEEKINPVIRGSFKSALKKVELRHLWAQN